MPKTWRFLIPLIFPRPEKSHMRHERHGHSLTMTALKLFMPNFILPPANPVFRKLFQIRLF